MENKITYTEEQHKWFKEQFHKPREHKEHVIFLGVEGMKLWDKFWKEEFNKYNKIND